MAQPQVKFWKERNLFTTIIKAGRGTVAKALMEPFIVIVFQILVYPLPCLPWILVILQVDVLIFQTPPETLNKDVVISPATVVHTDQTAGLPGQHIPEIPVNNRRQVQPAFLNGDIRNINAPDMVRIGG